MFSLLDIKTNGHDNIMDSHSKSFTRLSFESARAARLAAIQACFQCMSTSQPAHAVVQEFILHRLTTSDYPYPPDPVLFEKLVLRTEARQNDLSALIDGHLSEAWTLESIDAVLCCILKVGAVELLESLVPIPAPVVISEYIDLTRGFLGPSEANLTNAVLDSIAKSLGHQMSKDQSEK